MTVPQLAALCFDARDPAALGVFWSAVLDRDVSADGDGALLEAMSDAEFPVRFRPSVEPKTTPNRYHFDLTSASPEDQVALVERALAHGAQHLDVGQRPEERHVVLADPEGNEFCVIPSDNRFLAGTAAIGALSGDGTQRVGYFWAEALGWPLVWDENEETAIQSPEGGTKITWGGPPVRPKAGVSRLRFELGTRPEELAGTVERLVALGASPAPEGTTRDSDAAVVLTDPDGNEFTVRALEPLESGPRAAER